MARSGAGKAPLVCGERRRNAREAARSRGLAQSGRSCGRTRARGPHGSSAQVRRAWWPRTRASKGRGAGVGACGSTVGIDRCRARFRQLLRGSVARLSPTGHEAPHPSHEPGSAPCSRTARHSRGIVRLHGLRPLRFERFHFEPLAALAARRPVAKSAELLFSGVRDDRAARGRARAEARRTDDSACTCSSRSRAACPSSASRLLP